MTNHVQDSIKKNTQQNDQRNDSKNRKAQMFGTKGHFSSMGSSRNNQSTQALGAQSTWHCYHCWGWGHVAKECATPLNYLKGGVSLSLPQNKKNKKEQESQQTQPKQTQSPSKQQGKNIIIQII